MKKRRKQFKENIQLKVVLSASTVYYKNIGELVVGFTGN